MLFSRFSQYLQKLEETPSRLKMTEILAELFGELEIEEVPQACYLMQGSLVPSYESLEFQLSVKMVVRALAKYKKELAPSEISEINSSLFADFESVSEDDPIQAELTKRYKNIGDVGVLTEEVVAEIKKNVDSGDSPTLLQVYDFLAEIAREGGSGSQERKLDLLVHLFKKLDANSTKFVSRMIVGKLRLGFSTMTIFDALSWVKNGDKSLSADLENIYQKKADVGKLAQSYLSAIRSGGDFHGYDLEIGIPVVPALCQRLNSAQEIIEKMGEVLAESKYDGLRIQIHFKRVGGKNSENFVRAFTRNLENVTHMFPELQKIYTQLTCESCVLDAEAIGFSPESGELLPFQDTITRKRKHGVESQAQEVPIRFYVFDVMALDGKELLETPLMERKKILEKMLILDEKMPLFLSPYVITQDAKFLHEFHEEQLALGLEGAVIKKIDSLYKSGRKGWRWVKIKEEEGSRGKLSDTLDCIVMGYYMGRGKRSDFGIGAFLVGVMGKDENGELEIQTIAKIGTGLTDEQFRETKMRADKFVSSADGGKKPGLYKVHKNLFPDVWIDPGIVVEIAADELTRSPVHSVGKALRFPRLVRFRDDKTWEQATTREELGEIG